MSKVIFSQSLAQMLALWALLLNLSSRRKLGLGERGVCGHFVKGCTVYDIINRSHSVHFYSTFPIYENSPSFPHLLLK